LLLRISEGGQDWQDHAQEAHAGVRGHALQQSDGRRVPHDRSGGAA